jgi:hypothetical protein
MSTHSSNTMGSRANNHHNHMLSDESLLSQAGSTFRYGFQWEKLNSFVVELRSWSLEALCNPKIVSSLLSNWFTAEERKLLREACETQETYKTKRAFIWSLIRQYIRKIDDSAAFSSSASTSENQDWISEYKKNVHCKLPMKLREVDEQELLYLSRNYRVVLYLSKILKAKQNKYLFLENATGLEGSGQRCTSTGKPSNLTKRRLEIFRLVTGVTKRIRDNSNRKGYRTKNLLSSVDSCCEDDDASSDTDHDVYSVQGVADCCSSSSLSSMFLTVHSFDHYESNSEYISSEASSPSAPSKFDVMKMNDENEDANDNRHFDPLPPATVINTTFSSSPLVNYSSSFSSFGSQFDESVFNFMNNNNNNNDWEDDFLEAMLRDNFQFDQQLDALDLIDYYN